MAEAEDLFYGLGDEEDLLVAFRDFDIVEEKEEKDFLSMGLRYFDIVDDPPQPKVVEAPPAIPKLSLEEFLGQSYPPNTFINLCLNPDAELPEPFIVFCHEFPEHCQELKEWTDIFYEASQQNKDVSFVITEKLPEKIFDMTHPKNYFLFNRHYPPWTLAIDRNKRTYQLDGFITLPAVTEFARKLSTGELFTSEPLPSREPSSLVTYCVGETFEQIVMHNREEDVLLIMHADWCNISQNVVEFAEKVAYDIKGDRVRICVINPEKNYVPVSYHTHGFPRLIYRRRGEDERIDYNQGPWHPRNLIKFIARQATDELENYGRNGRRRMLY